MTTLFACYLAVFASRLGLRRLNLRHLQRRGHTVPPGFEAAVDAQQLARSREYTLANARVDLAESLVGSAVLLGFLFGGGLELYDRWVLALVPGPVLAGVLFLLGLHWAQTLLGVPFGLTRTFGVEARYGFNRTTPRLWLADLAKSELVGVVLLSILAGAILGLLQASPRWWWLWAWGFFAGFSVLMLYLSPQFIEPLFFHFEPVQAPDLERRIRDLADRAGLGVSRVLQVDASRRSGHSNATFSGIGRVKRIVLFDTLLTQMAPDEVLAVVAHEMGHWKLHHMARRLGFALLGALAAFWVAHLLLTWSGLPGLVGAEQLSTHARLLVLSVIGSLARFPLTPLSSGLSRRHERQADRYATDLTGAPRSLASALVKLGTENLANLHPHPLYAWFYFSHPPLSGRVAALEGPAAVPDPCPPESRGHNRNRPPSPGP
ncbi:MAG: M48 family metallopeptidase [Deferrisomatales bacterium]|nr:M48 family metallopeptidase [Deferrisomatales bacterium]